ncbi:MAG: transposase [Cyanobacteriota bacterium]
MGMRLQVCLTPEEERTLWELENASGVPQLVRNRAQIVRMNARGDCVEQITEFGKLSRQSVCNPFRRWQNEGLAGLFEAKGRGRPRRWKDEAMELIEKVLEEDERTYNGA